MKLRILYVAYALLPVSGESAGGAEQMLWTVERGMASRGHRTCVAACEKSRVAGELFATGRTPDGADQFVKRNTEHNTRVVEYICQRVRAGNGFDLVHDKSGHFWQHASALPIPVLATLHLPRSFYAVDFASACASNLFFNCVSSVQVKTFPDLPGILGVIENGIELDRFPLNAGSGGRDYLLWIGRICEEKGTHFAIDVAERAGLPLIVAGQIYPFSYHQNYFAREIRPRLERARVRVQIEVQPSFRKKVELFRGARALLVPSLVDETSSLVSMEAMACGTPILALNRGALPDVVAHGETGFVVNSPDEMVNAVPRLHDISPLACRSRVEKFYSASRMVSEYESLYARVVANSNLQDSRAA